MLVVDVETSGLNPQQHAILSIGAIDFENPERQFFVECQLFPGAEVQTEALKVNGFTVEQIQDSSKKTLEQIMLEFITWADESNDKTIAGQNPTFDRDFLDEACKKCQIKYNFGKRTVDLHALAYSTRLQLGFPPLLRNKESVMVSDLIMGFVGIPAEPRPHVALNGAKWETEAFHRLIYGKKILPEFEQFEIPEYLKN